MDPYATNQASQIYKAPLAARLTTVHATRRMGRGIEPAIQKTRCIVAGAVHELIIFEKADPETGLIDSTGYLGFAEFLSGGVLEVGDSVYVNAQYLGELAGFDETHMPNHLNLLIRREKMTTGVDWGCQYADLVSFISPKRL